MVLVDIFVPSVDKTYNFSLNETARIDAVIAEITEMIEQKERVSLAGEQQKLHLYDSMGGKILPKENTLFDCYIKNGTNLILV